MRSALLILVAAGLIALGEATARADTITIPNYSFEDPTDQLIDGFAISTTITNWNTTGQLPDSELGGYDDVGSFANLASDEPTYGEYRIQNADQNQLAYMFSDGTTLSQGLTDTYQAGMKYTLTVGVANAGALPAVGDTLTIQLIDETTNAILATENVVDGSNFASDLSQAVGGTPLPSQQNLQDFSAEFYAPSSGGGVGDNIGILFTATGSGAGEFDLDNVRLTETAAPEPSTIGLVGIAGLSLLARRRAVR